MGSYLATLANAIGGLFNGGGQTVQPIPPLSPSGGPVPGAPPAQTPPAGAVPSPPAGGSPSSGGGFMQGVGNFLGSPLTQAALSGYFGAIGSPRKAGLGGMLSRGGLSGLSAYDAAQEAQQKAALQSAQIGQAQAGIPLTQAQTQLTQAQAGQIAGIKQHNSQVAAALMSASSTMQPAQKQAATTIANMIANDTSKAYDPTQLLNAIYTDPVKAQEAIANTNLATARAGAIPSEIAKNTAAANKDARDAATGGIKPRPMVEYDASGGSKVKYVSPSDPNPDPGDSFTKPEKGPKGTDPLSNLTKARALYTATYGSGVTKLGYELAGGTPAPTFEDFARNQLGIDPNTGQRLATSTGAEGGTSAGSLPPLPAGATSYAKGPDGEVGYHDASGTFHPF